MTFNKGDRVRLFSLSGELTEQVFTLNDVWGDESYPRNASFVTFGAEQTTHTDLMKHEDDASPVVVPDGGEWYIARGDNYGWGRAKTVEAAIRNMRANGGKATEYVVHRVSKWTVCDGMGSLSYPQGIEPVEVKRMKSKKSA